MMIAARLAGGNLFFAFLGGGFLEHSEQLGALGALGFFEGILWWGFLGALGALGFFLRGFFGWGILFWGWWGVFWIESVGKN